MLQPGADVANSPPHTVRIPWRVFKLCNHRVPYRIFLKIYEEGRAQWATHRRERPAGPGGCVFEEAHHAVPTQESGLRGRHARGEP